MNVQKRSKTAPSQKSQNDRIKSARSNSRAADRTKKAFNSLSLSTTKPTSNQPWKKQLDTQRLKSFQCVNKRKQAAELLSQLSPASYTLKSFTDEIANQITGTDKIGKFSKLPKYSVNVSRTGSALGSKGAGSSGAPKGAETNFRPASPSLYLEKYRKSPERVFMDTTVGREDSTIYRNVRIAQDEMVPATTYGTMVLRHKGIGAYIEDPDNYPNRPPKTAAARFTTSNVFTKESTSTRQASSASTVNTGQGSSSSNQIPQPQTEQNTENQKTGPNGPIKKKKIYKPTNNHALSFKCMPTGQRLPKIRKLITDKCQCCA